MYSIIRLTCRSFENLIWRQKTLNNDTNVSIDYSIIELTFFEFSKPNNYFCDCKEYHIMSVDVLYCCEYVGCSVNTRQSIVSPIKKSRIYNDSAIPMKYLTTLLIFVF